jgi:tRNA (guanine-N7-)-methyltransferase
MRRKKHLEERLAECGDMIIFMDREDRNFAVKDNEHMLDFNTLFGNDNPVVLEIGCGKGQFIRELAKRNPDCNYIAV